MPHSIQHNVTPPHSSAPHVCEGEFRCNSKDGRGVYTYKDGNAYDGEWRGNAQDGRGTLRFADGDVYVGDFRADKRDGRGADRDTRTPHFASAPVRSCSSQSPSCGAKAPTGSRAGSRR